MLMIIIADADYFLNMLMHIIADADEKNVI